MNLTAAQKAIASSIKLLQTQSKNTTQQRILANSLDIKGSIERSQGKSQIALKTWQQAENIYQELENNRAIIKNNINQAQALQDLGYYRRASQNLQSIKTKLINEPDSPPKMAALLSLGNTLRATGNLEKSLLVLQQAFTIAEELNLNEPKNTILLSLGNTLRVLGNTLDESPNIQEINLSTPSCLAANNLNNATIYYLQAANCYQQSVLFPNLSTQTKAQLNLPRPSG
ncbi:conserved hypothetical protein [Hyella patelloides LEGE 07179]|uniref:Uncharacterized protein n=1 Tax=Hyella patelloides LEGE 07179 TaxID=945734 RepID=A0A563VWC6_9CYAN|nr:hypothetical protein [Hyella patelloides]VEP15752.1 conserved hypothetical protein [Hyella patelloides LEGE 07179]